MTSVRSRASLVALAGLALLVIVFWADCLFGANTPLAARFQAEMEPWRSEAQLTPPDAQWDPLLWDGVAQFYPWRLFAARELRAGRLALWNPHQFCGYPFAANGQSAIFYPPNWLLALVDVRWGMGLLAALHVFMAAGLTFAYARCIGLSAPAAAFGGIAFAWGGFMTGWLELPTLVNTATWLPGAFLGVALIFARSRWGAPILATSLGLSLLAGHFQIAAYVWVATALYAALRALWEAVNHRAWHPGALVTGLMLGGLLGTAQALPTLELIANSPRGGGSVSAGGFEFQRQRALQPTELGLLLRPNLFGNPAHGDHLLVRYGIPYAEHCGFVGIVTVLLALAGLAVARSRHYAFFLLLGALALNAAMLGPVARVMYFGIPKLGLAGSFTRILSVYTFAVALAGAVGLDALMRWLTRRAPHRRLRVRPSALLATMALVVLVYELLPWAYDYLPKTQRANVYPVTPTIRRLVATEGRVLAVTPRAGWSMTRTPPALLPPNAATVYAYDSVSGYDSLFPRSQREFLAAAEGADPAPLANGNLMLPEAVESRAYALAGVAAIATMPYEEVGRGVVVDAVAGLPRAFTVAEGEGRPTDGAPGQVIPARYRRASPGIIAVSGVIATGPDPMLVVTETFYPRWNAYVNGERRAVVPSAGPFCGVPLRGGDETVRLVFEPAAVHIGIFAALLGLAGLSGLIVFGHPRRHVPL